MKWSVAALGFAATALAGAAPPDLKPKGNAPEGCSATHDGEFMVSIFKLGDQKQKRDLAKRDCGGPNTLVLKLNDGVLKDRQDRTGAIVANYQFQFDGPPQAGSIYTAGFSTCNNGSLALGPSTVFWQCLSGDFYNLYDRHWAKQCEPVEIVAQSCNGAKQPENDSGNPGGNGKKPVGTSMVVTTVVTALKDGQPQVVPTTIAVPMCQIGDGQIQAHTTPCDKVPVNPPVTQISDGQIQAPTNPPAISQIGDGQVQAPGPSGKPVSQISDGQVQAPSAGAPVTQIGDGQVQAPTGGAPVTQISDGQVQAPTGAPITQISDGQVQAPTGAPSAPSTPVAAGNKEGPVAALLAAGLAAVLFL